MVLNCLVVVAQDSYPLEDSARIVMMKEVSKKHPRIQIPTPPYAYSVENVSFKDDETGLQYGGTLTKPEGKDDFPTVVLISGTGAQDRDYTGAGHKFFWTLADYLSTNGIAVLRVDDRGVGETNGIYVNATSLDFAKDTQAALKWLNTRADIKHNRIGLIGHSEGGIIAPMVYKLNPNLVKFMVLISGPTVGLRVINTKQTTDFYKASFKDNDTLVKANMRIHQFVVDRIPKEAHDDASLDILLRKTSDSLNYLIDPKLTKRIGLGDGAGRPFVLKGRFMSFLKPWWQFILAYDPINDLKLVECPVLGIYGDKDQQVPPKESLSLLRKNLPRNKYTKMKMYKNMNHFMQPDLNGDPKNYENISTTIMPEVLMQISSWINSQKIESKI